MMGSVVVRQRSSDGFERSRGAAFHRAIGPSGLDVERTRVLPTVLTRSGVNILLNVASAASPGDAHRFTACADIGMSPWPVPKLISCRSELALENAATLSMCFFTVCYSPARTGVSAELRSRRPYSR